jgi:hypothetical protein
VVVIVGYESAHVIKSHRTIHTPCINVDFLISIV